MITHRHLYLLLIPITLDLFLWLGPRLSAAPLITPFIASPGDAASGAALGLSQEIANVNLIALLSVVIPSAVNSNQVLFATSGPLLGTLNTWGQLALAASLLIAFGVAVGAVYRAAAVQGILRPTWTRGGFVSTLTTRGPRYGAFLLLIGGLGALALFAVSFLVLGLSSLSPAVGGLASLLVTGFAFWLFFLFWMADSAIFVTGVGPLEALVRSAQVARLYFWPSAGLFLLTRGVGLGMIQLWSRIGESAVALPAAIFINAYIATGLTVAAMLYFRDRSYMLRWT